VLVLMTPSLVPQVARWFRTFPAPGAGGPSSDRWTAANLVRVATIAPAFGLLAWALVLCGRAAA
jgi:hypothetical protein